MFENFTNSLLTYILSSIPLIGYSIKVTIDNLGATELERIRLSNFKKIQIALTKHVIISIVFVASVGLILIFSGAVSKTDMNQIYNILILSFIIFIATFFLVERFTNFTYRLLSIKYDYHIVNEEGEAVYRIVKRSSYNTLLVEDNNGIEEFIDAKENRRYKKIRRENKTLSKMYNSAKMPWFILISGIVCIVLIIIILFTNFLIQIVLYLIFLFIMIISMIIALNYWIEKRNNDENTR